jgi:hypothetical protein
LLPEPGRSLVEMSGRDLDAAASAFGALASSPAAWRSLSEGRASVSFGQTAAAKAFFAIRPLAFPPWDEPIRVALGLRGEGGSGYRSYLEQVALVLGDLADRLRVPVSRVPAALGRPRSTPPKLVDEVLWMLVNRPGAEGPASVRRILEAEPTPVGGPRPQPPAVPGSAPALG